MKHYLKNLLPRLQQYSKSLDHIENFVGQPWVLVDDALNRQVYVFQRDNSLIMSLNGQAQEGKWSYVPAVQSLLVDRGVDKILLNHAFVEKGLMVLKKDGYTEAPWVLINEREIPDLNVERYLKDLLIKKLNLKPHYQNGQMYYYADPYNTGLSYSCTFYDADLNRLGGPPFTIGESYTRSYSSSSYGSSVVKGIHTNRGRLRVSTDASRLSIGTEIWLEASFESTYAPDGVYKLSDSETYHSFMVKEGKIVSLKTKKDRTQLIVIIVVFILLIVLSVIQIRKENERREIPTQQN